MGRAAGLAWPQRVQVWDASLAAVRGCLRGAGLAEVTTPIRVGAVALEPWIEPIAAGDDQLLATSPELAMKQLLARGGRSMFQIAHVFRAAERGARHREEFHLVEWYREAGGARVELDAVIADVERMVAAVFEAIAALDLRPAPAIAAPRRWRRVEILELMSQTLGVALAGDEDAHALAPILAHVRAAAGLGLTGDGTPGFDPRRDPDPALDDLRAWTELFSLWSDLHLDPWLAAGDPDLGVHVVAFPRALAALAEHEDDGKTAARFESHVGGVELANGYRELRDVDEQRARFAAVARLRAAHALPALPTPEAFLAELDRLPPCAGAALGLDRLIALACGVDSLAEVCLDPAR